LFKPHRVSASIAAALSFPKRRPASSLSRAIFVSIVPPATDGLIGQSVDYRPGKVTEA
jgi:hypothetical protein